MSFNVSSIKRTVTYVCYATETVLPLVAIGTNNVAFVAANLFFATVGTVCCMSRLGDPSRTHDLHNCAHLIGFGTTIASLAVGTSSAAFVTLCSMTVGCFGGNIAMECFDGCLDPETQPAPQVQVANVPPPVQIEYYSGPAHHI